jgi:hypothetical protein
MDWKNLAIGMGNAIGQVVPQMERMSLAEDEMKIRNETHGIQMDKYREEQDIKKGLEDIAAKHFTMAKTLPQTGAVGGTNSPVSIPAAAPQMGEVAPPQETTISGAPNVDTGTGVSVGQPVNKVPTGEATPAVNNLGALGIRGNMLMEMHDFLMSKGKIAEAKQLKKAEMDNLFNIAKISPKAALKSWNNTPWLVEQYGPLSPEDITKEGDWSFMKLGEDGLVKWNKRGDFQIVQKPTVTGKQPTPSMYVEKPIGPNTQQKFQFNEKTSQHDIPFGEPYRIHKPEGGGEGDAKKDAKEFRREIGGLDGLYKSRAAIEKGLDPITGAVIPQTQIDEAKATIQGQIDSKEEWMKTEYPEQWSTYRKPKAGAIGGVDKGRKSNVDYLQTYFKENAKKFSQKQIYDQLTKNGYGKEAIIEAWQQYKAANPS